MKRPENEETTDKAVSVWAIPHHFTTPSPVNYTDCRDKGLLSCSLMKWALSRKFIECEKSALHHHRLQGTGVITKLAAVIAQLI